MYSAQQRGLSYIPLSECREYTRELRREQEMYLNV
jgi:hypothetical protein